MEKKIAVTVVVEAFTVAVLVLLATLVTVEIDTTSTSLPQSTFSGLHRLE